MLGRKNYTTDEIDHARSTVDSQLAAYAKLVEAVRGTSDPQAAAALEEFERLFSNNMALVLDRYFVHRLRTATGKDGNPLNELELLTESLMNNDGILRGNNVIKYVPETSVLQLRIGDRIRLTAAQFEGLAKAFFAEIESKFT
jgi:hypothetical protein